MATPYTALVVCRILVKRTIAPFTTFSVSNHFHFCGVNVIQWECVPDLIDVRFLLCGWYWWFNDLIFGKFQKVFYKKDFYGWALFCKIFDFNFNSFVCSDHETTWNSRILEFQDVSLDIRFAGFNFNSDARLFIREI